MNQGNNKEKSENIRKIAVVRIRGGINIRRDIKKTLGMLRLYRQNYCIVVPKTQSYLGMVNKVKDYVTWGEVDDQTFKLLIEKKGEMYKGRETDTKGIIKYKKFMAVNGKKVKTFFKLHPPKKGFERRGIKKPFSTGGALGYRKEKINDLLKRMI